MDIFVNIVKRHLPQIVKVILLEHQRELRERRRLEKWTKFFANGGIWR